MSVKFNYICERGIWRPIIPIFFISAEGSQFAVDGLIDSGATKCLFPGYIAMILGHDVSKGTFLQKMMIGGKKINSYLHKTKVIAIDKPFSWDIYFSHDIDDWEFGILGQDPFFSNFKIIFNYKKKEFFLEHYV